LFQAPNNKSNNKKKIKYNKHKMNKNIIMVGAIAAGLYLLSQGKKTAKVVVKKKAPQRPKPKYPKPHPHVKQKIKKAVAKKKTKYNKPKIKKAVAKKKTKYNKPKIKKVIAKKKQYKKRYIN